MALICLAPPLVEPVFLSELKDMLRMDASDTSQDDVLSTLEVAARTWCETVTNRRFVQQTWALYMDFFPGYIDQKMAGQKFSSPFVSGANAVLVGIRYAVILPFPPIQQLISFNYQDANGTVTSMIVPLTIASVSNPLGGNVTVNTTTPHGLQSSSTVNIAGNAPLLALCGGQATQVVTNVGPSSLILQGVLGTGTTIPSTGTITGYNFVQDFQSQPARLTPIFGQMWPVARVVANAVQMVFQCGYATPLTVSVIDGNPVLSATGLTSLNNGQPISIPGMGANGGALNTIVQSVDGSGNATLRDAPLGGGTPAAPATATALLITNGTPGHWDLIRTAIKFLVNSWFVERLPSFDAKTRDCIRAILGPAMDLRL
jgi:hypothetical protein